MRNRDLLDRIGRRDDAGVAALLAAGAPVEQGRWRRVVARTEPTPLLTAVRAGSPEIVERLLDAGADPDRGTATWMPPLALACQLGDRPVARLLIDRGADTDPRPGRHPSPIEAAAWHGHEDLVALLLDRGADPNRVLARGVGSLVLVPVPILARLLAAGGHAPAEIEALVEQST